MSSTLLESLERAARRQDLGLRFLDRHELETFIPFSEIHDRSLEVACRLQAAGVSPGERVALVFPTCAEFVTGLFGALLAGAVPVPLYPPVRLGRLAEYLSQTARMLAASRAVLVLASGKVRAVLGEAIASARPRLGCRTIEELPAGVLRAVSPDPSGLALVQFSSGRPPTPGPSRSLIGR